ncbi:MAG: hypothetical protein Q9191_007344, partial [Dirinaria sp. TL-2023a]
MQSRRCLLAGNSAKVLRRALSGPIPSRSFATAIDPGQKDPTELDQITTLPNGIRVATESLPGPFSGVGVYLDAGSRFEDKELSGVSHIVDRLAFKSASFNSSVPTTLGLLAETIREPKITDQEVQQQLETAEYEIGEIWAKPELILPELVNVAAYKDNTLGNPLLCPQERLQYINRDVVNRYRRTFFRPERMVVAFAGVSHDAALKLTQQYFGDMLGNSSPLLSGTGLETSFTDSNPSSRSSSPSSSSSSSSYTTPSSTTSTPPSQPSRLLQSIPFLKNLSTSASHHASVSDITPSTPFDLNAPSHYTGGFLSLPARPPPANPALPHLSHIHLAFEAIPIASDDIYALATLQTLLGGGGSFSAGGPGKGMYSRLYMNVLNQYGWVESCVAFNHSYTDSGLFGISASCTPQRVTQMLEVMCRELQSLTLDSGHAGLQETEVRRAKNQLRSSLLMNLESRMVELEDLGRQVQVHGRKVGVREMCRKIDDLTVADLRRVAKAVVEGKVANVGQGSGAPTVVLQEGEREGLTARGGKGFEWGEIQERIARWQLGR